MLLKYLGLPLEGGIYRGLIRADKEVITAPLVISSYYSHYRVLSSIGRWLSSLYDFCASFLLLCAITTEPKQ